MSAYNEACPQDKGAALSLSGTSKNPFGEDANALPTDQIAGNIGFNVREILLRETGS